MPSYFEDLAPGTTFTSVGRTVTEADIMAFAGVSGDFNRLHTDEPWVAANTPFKGRIAHGLLVLAISSGVRTPGLDDLELIAYMNETRRFRAPTYPGDTLTVEWRVKDARLSSSRPGTGVVTMEVVTRNDRGEVVQDGDDVWLMACRPEAGS